MKAAGGLVAEKTEKAAEAGKAKNAENAENAEAAEVQKTAETDKAETEKAAADKAEKTEGQTLKISYFAKEELLCPVCAEHLRREELFSGSGRLIAGDLTDELHRLYEKSAKYGILYPLAYQATVCPRCFFASMEKDFLELPEDSREKASEETAERKREVELIAPGISFYDSRTLLSGAVSQYLVMRCYDYYPPEVSPAIKQGLAALRAGWLFDDLNLVSPGKNYDWLASALKKKACFFYGEALNRETMGKESLGGLSNYGPDTDKNYGYQGVLYIRALLEFKYGDTYDSERRLSALVENKRNLAKMFGMGKASKSKPGSLLEKSRILYDTMAQEIDEFDV